MWCGVRWARGDLPAERWALRVWIPGLCIAVVLLVLRYTEIAYTEVTGVDPGPVLLIDKWHLGIVRLVDFAAVAAVVVRFHKSFEPLAVRPLVLLGQSSLYVFCTHFLFCFAGLAMSGSADHVQGWPQFALLAAAFATLMGVAKFFARRELSVPRRLPGPGRRGDLSPACWQRPRLAGRRALKFLLDISRRRTPLVPGPLVELRASLAIHQQDG